MVDTEQARRAALKHELEDSWWVDEARIPDDDEMEVEVHTSQVPDLRDVYDIIEEAEPEGGAVHVEGETQSWTVDIEDGEVAGVERTGGMFTVNRMSLLERFFHGINFLGVYTIFASIVTLVATFFWTTPLSLIGMDGLFGVAVMFGVGLAAVIFGSVMYQVVPGMSEGSTATEPGDGIAGFRDLPDRIRAAFIAEDDAKSRRNEGLLLKRQRTLGLIGMFGFAAYIGVIGYMNAGAIGVLVAGGLFAVKTGIQLLLTLTLVGSLDEARDPYIDGIMDEIKAAADGTLDPTVLVYGDEDNPIHENVAMAVPEKNTIIVPLADIKKLHRDELESIIAHEFEHVRSHYPLWLAGIKGVLLLAPGIALFFVSVQLSLLQVGVGLLLYFALLNALASLVQRRWEYQADAFAEEVASPVGLAIGLTRVTDQHVVDANNSTMLSGSTGELYGSHPFPHRRITKLVSDVNEQN